ncbi:MAG TPA: voltage-gated chloride channel, partial [Deltaproteobacteria bacterium]|nr:voltage-gated chloride channel [Deltaproteobacteria bacterium]
MRYLAPDAGGRGTEKVIEAVHKQSGNIKALVVPLKLITTVLTIASGGSAGKEGPCAQIGAGLSSIFANLFRFAEGDRKKLVICGISAGFSSVFGTPIAGAIFGVEVLFVGGILYDVLLPSFISGLISYQISSGLGITYFYHPIEFVHVFSESFFLKVVLSGIFFGICSFSLIEVLTIGERISKRIKIWSPVKGIIGGSVIVALTFLFSVRYLGLGLESIEFYLQGGNAAWYDFILKTIFTSITLNFGGSGGINTPMFFIGAASGSLFAGVMGEDIATFSAIGLVSLLAGAANTPIAASIMAVELFGAEIAPYAAVACVISFLMTGHRSVYPSQILSIKKSSSIEVEIGKELEGIKPEYRPRRKSLISVC